MNKISQLSVNGFAVRKSELNKSHQVVTLEMVATKAGVSPSTVSRILNGTAVVSADKKKAVEEAISTLGFIPNPIARGLAGGKTLSVGVVTQAIDSPFYGVALRGIEAELDLAGYSALFVSGHWDAKTESKCVDVLLSRRVDGIIVLTGRLTNATLKSCAKRVPIVVTGRSLKAPQLYSLHFDNVEGGRLATQHLVSLGHRRIAHISGSLNHPDAADRLLGYREALVSAGIGFDAELVVSGDFSEASGLLAARQLLEKKCDFSAIFAANDQMALGAALALHQRGLRIPGDVSLVGFDDLPAATYAWPPLTSVHESAYELGRLAALSMLQLLQGIRPGSVLPGPRLIQRDSTAAI